MSNLVETLARKIDAYLSCKATGKSEWMNRHLNAIEYLEKEVLPRGSGIDMGMMVNIEESTGERIVIDIPFHHMDENGYYCGWVDYRAVVTPSLRYDFEIDVSVTSDGSDTEVWDRETTMDYLGDLLHHTLSQEYDETRLEIV